MQAAMRHVLTFSIALSVGLLSACGGRTGMPDRPDVGNLSGGKQLDRNLLALANDPSLLQKIDQKKNFNNEDAYRGVLQKAMDLVSKSMPAVLKENGAPNLTTSVCVADSRVYFWNALGDRDIIGWVSTPDITDNTMEIPVLTVLVIPQLQKETPFVTHWREDTKEGDLSSTRALVRTALDIDVMNAQAGDGQQVRWTTRVDDEEHRVTICRSGNVLQVEMGLLPDVCMGKPGKPLVSKPVLTFVPRDLPFWPPK